VTAGADLTPPAAPRPGPPSAGAAPVGQRILAQTGMELRLLLRNGENLLVALGIPVGMVAFFALVPVVDFDEPAVDFLLPGAITVAIMGTAMVSLAISTGFERFYLVLKRLGATPLRRGELVTAKISAVLAVQLVQLAVLIAIAAALGWPVDARPGGGRLVLLPVGMLLGTAAFAGIGLAMAGRLRATATLALVNATFIVLVLASGLVFPLDSLPGPLGLVTAALPSAALGEVLRAALGAGGPLPLGELMLLGGWAIASCTLAARLFRWE
jgi:ABC-2 type transport system permease protein